MFSKLVAAAVVCTLALSSLACAAPFDGEEEIGSQESAVSYKNTNSGTALAQTGKLGYACLSATSATLTFSGELTSSASNDSAVVSITGAFSDSWVIEKHEWLKAKSRYKYAYVKTSGAVGTGEQMLNVCFTQSGADGRESKESCASYSITVDCSYLESIDG